MVTVLVLFGRPRDETTFDDYFERTHHPLLARLPNIERVVIHPVAGAAVGASPYHLIVELRCPSDDAMQDSLNGRDGQAMARDFQVFASGGVTVLFCQSILETGAVSERP